jgi:hypothetical protein
MATGTEMMLLLLRRRSKTMPTEKTRLTEKTTSMFKIITKL